ncbi:hypothetical protein K0M31_009653 [Melipona bicolor]|uniref:Uncharacterized protein n=1 Tax=Melipona bicolor TaxID=60889 RepID=A0AA40FNH8_9HYME|nr:hypothetical protein K0M31_009653 [Melipona bicolor]
MRNEPLEGSARPHVFRKAGTVSRVSRLRNLERSAEGAVGAHLRNARLSSVQQLGWQGDANRVTDRVQVDRKWFWLGGPPERCTVVIVP